MLIDGKIYSFLFSAKDFLLVNCKEMSKIRIYSLTELAAKQQQQQQQVRWCRKQALKYDVNSAVLMHLQYAIQENTKHYCENRRHNLVDVLIYKQSLMKFSLFINRTLSGARTVRRPTQGRYSSVDTPAKHCKPQNYGLSGEINKL